MPLEGGGGRPPIGPLLGITPSSLAFGDVVDGQTVDLTLTFTNLDTVDSLTVSLPTIDNARFTFTGTIGTLTPLQSKDLIVTFAPTATGAQAGTLTAVHTGINTPRTVALAGTGVAAGTKSLGVDPSSWDFGDQKIAIPTSEKLFTITNTGDVDVEITGITFTAPFSAGGTAPSTPFTLTSGQTEAFGVIFTPTAVGLVSQTSVDGTLVTDGAFDDGTDWTKGTGWAIAAGVASKSAGVGSDLEQNQDVVEGKTYEVIYTVANRTAGTVVVKVAGTSGASRSTNATFTERIVAGSGVEPKLEFTADSSFDGDIDDVSVIQTSGASVASDASSSPFNVETLGTGFLIAPAFTVTGADGGLLLGFVTGSTVVIKRADPDDLDCEEAGSFKRLHDFGLPGVEKAIQRVRFRYEDLGVATVNVQLRAIRPTIQSVSQNVVIGTAGAGEDIKNAFADLVMAHDLIEVQFSRLAGGGPVSITEYDPRVEERGEVIAAT